MTWFILGFVTGFLFAALVNLFSHTREERLDPPVITGINRNK